MGAVETQGGRIRPRVAPGKALASAVTMGSGGSVGQIGPVAQVSASLASSLGRVMRQPPEMMTLLVAGGAAGGVSASFNAPIAGVFFALEVILRRFNVRNFTLVVVSSVIATLVAIAIVGSEPGIAIPSYELVSSIEIGFYALLGLAAALVGILFFRLVYLAEDLISAIPMPALGRPALAMLAVGAIGFWHHEIFGIGFGVIEDAAVGEIAVGTLALLLVLKVVATSLTIGGGSSGGLFAPALFVGAMLGGLMGAGFEAIAPNNMAPAGAYAVVGAAAVFAAAARAPITSLFIVFELTRDYELILPLMTAVAIATGVAQIITRDTVYSIKLARIGVRIREEPSRAAMDQITAAEAMHTDVPLVDADATLDELALVLSRAGGSAVAVTDEGNRFQGLITATDVTAALERSGEDIRAADIGRRSTLYVHPDDSLRDVVAMLADADMRQVPVVARFDQTRLLGMVSQRDVLTAFARSTQPADPRRERTPIRRLVGAAQVDTTVEPGSALAGVALQAVPLPQQAVISTIRRQGVVVIPRGGVQLEPGDEVTILVEAGFEGAVRRMLADVVHAPAHEPDPLARSQAGEPHPRPSEERDG
jgi:CIC family chloride channel protein